MAYLLAVTALPAEFTGIFTADPYRVVKNWHICICVVAGLWGGLIIGIVTEYYTSNRYTPVQVGLGERPLGLSADPLLCQDEGQAPAVQAHR